jgi:hypothetical protein
LPSATCVNPSSAAASPLVTDTLACSAKSGIQTALRHQRLRPVLTLCHVEHDDAVGYAPWRNDAK